MLIVSRKAGLRNDASFDFALGLAGHFAIGSIHDSTCFRSERRFASHFDGLLQLQSRTGSHKHEHSQLEGLLPRSMFSSGEGSHGNDGR